MPIGGMLRVISEKGNRMQPCQFFQDVQAADSATRVGGDDAAGFHPQNSHDNHYARGDSDRNFKRLEEFLILGSQVELRRRREGGARRMELCLA